MTAELTGLVVDIEARTKKLEQGLKRANDRQRRAARDMETTAQRSAKKIEQTYSGMADNIGRRLKGLTGPLGAFAGGMLGALAGGFVTSRTASDIRRTLASIGSSIGNAADRASIGTEALQGLQYGFELSGVSADSLNAALERFNRRVGEAANGAGPLQTTLDRYGLSVRDANGELKAQERMLRDVAEAIRRVGSDQERAAIAQAAFGDVGRKMVLALRNGSTGIDEMIEHAREGGFIIEDELVRRAEELDAKFAELTKRVEVFGKRLAVGIAGAAVELTDFRERLDKIFASEAEGRAILGDEVYDALAASRDLLDENANAAGRLRQAHEVLARDARAAAYEMGVAAQEMPVKGFDEQRAALAAVVEEMTRLADGLEAGTIEAGEFQDGMDEATRSAEALFKALRDDHGIFFANVSNALDGLAGKLGAAISLAVSLRGALQEATGTTPDQKRLAAMRARQEAETASLESLERMSEANDRFAASEAARNEASTEQLRLQREIEAVRKRAGEAGATLTAAQAEATARAALAADDARRAADKAGRGGGGGRSGKAATLDEFTREAQAIRDRTSALQIEAEALAQVADARFVMAGAMDFARAKADLLVAAQRAGLRVTPELRAEIDRLAESYAKASEEARKNAEAVQEAADAQGRAAGRMTDFARAGIREGKEGLARELERMADEILGQMLTEIFSAFMAQAGQMAGAQAGGGGGNAGAMIAQVLMSMFGFERGGWTGNMGVSQVAGVVHGQEFVFSAPAVRAIGAGNLDQLHKAARNGYQAGGLVGHAGKLHQAVSGPPSAAQAAPQINITGSPITVNANGGTPEANADLARQISEQTERSMRALVHQELIREMKPGGSLSRLAR